MITCTGGENDRYSTGLPVEYWRNDGFEWDITDTKEGRSGREKPEALTLFFNPRLSDLGLLGTANGTPPVK